jgi:hypothetical protein
MKMDSYLVDLSFIFIKKYDLFLLMLFNKRALYLNKKTAEAVLRFMDTH